MAHLFKDLMESVPADPSAHRRRRDPAAYEADFAEAVRLYDRVLDGDRYAAMVFTEAMSTSDFPLLFGDIMDRAVVGAYREYPSDILKITRKRTVSDFRSVRDFAVDGAEGQLAEVPQGTEYPEASLTESRDTWAVAKYGRVVRFLWETMVNDDLDALRDTPARLGKAARRTQAKLITQQYVDSTGPHASLYTSGNANIVTSNPALSTNALATAFGILGAQVDSDGEPIFVGDAVYLVVPPALEVTARNILNAIHLDLTTTGGAISGSGLRAENWMKNRTQLIVDPYIPIVSSSSNGNTSWFLFGDPNSGRPALSHGVLKGHEEPDLRVKSPDSTRVGGGPISPEEGDFETDSIAYRVRHVMGATRHSTGGAKTTVGSEGDGS